MTYQLEKYKGKSTRYDCPRCGQKRTFTRYVDEQGDYLADDVGRCNRENGCGYHYPPKQYWIDHSSERTPFRQARPVATPRTQSAPSIKRFDVIPRQFLDGTLHEFENNRLLQFLLTRFDVEAVTATVAKYQIGTARNGGTVFWQVNERGQVLTGKIILYDPNTGKRDKAKHPDWAHRRLIADGHLPQDFNFQQCLFGQHLLPLEPDAVVAVVEAEKTAVIASLVLPDFLWVATGGKENSVTKKLASLKRRRVVMFPDGDAFERWQQYADEARASGLDVECSQLIEANSTADERQSGYDLADYLLQSAQETGETFSGLVDLLDKADAYALEERAAVYEFEAKFSRQEAEQKAMTWFIEQQSTGHTAWIH